MGTRSTIYLKQVWFHGIIEFNRAQIQKSRPEDLHSLLAERHLQFGPLQEVFTHTEGVGSGGVELCAIHFEGILNTISSCYSCCFTSL